MKPEVAGDLPCPVGSKKAQHARSEFQAEVPENPKTTLVSLADIFNEKLQLFLACCNPSEIAYCIPGSNRNFSHFGAC
jgi:hypothetical protein